MTQSLLAACAALSLGLSSCSPAVASCARPVAEAVKMVFVVIVAGTVLEVVLRPR